MRQKFEQQIKLGRKLIQDLEVDIKNRDAFTKLVISLKALYLSPELSSKIFNILEVGIIGNTQATGRNGMDLWQIFVLAHTRLCLNISYDRLHHMANNDSLLRQLLGIEGEYGFTKIKIEYQNILDNVHLLDDETLNKCNDVLVEFGHKVFKKKEAEPLNLKTDSFVVESNVHFPTDYNLLWDSARKCIDTIEDFIEKYSDIPGWRNLNYWYKELKNRMRELAQSAKKCTEKQKEIAEEYLEKARLFSEKLKKERDNLPLVDVTDLDLHIWLDYFEEMLDKHIDLLDRRLLKDETIPQGEKIFSIFETYTEWLNKGKQHPSVELGKNLQITTDQFNLIVAHRIMVKEVDKSTVIALVDYVLNKYKVASWSFDKGFYTKENRELISLFINNLVMPKKGKLNNSEKEEEHTTTFKKFRNKHSAIESNINELENKGLDRCPDRGYKHFKNYIGVAVCAYNLHRIGAELIRQAKQETPSLKQSA